jgi:hypothetical protein
MRRAYDVIFETDALISVGYGHVARCITLAKLSTCARPNGRTAFRGHIEARILQRLNTELPDIDILPICDLSTSRLCVIDTMANPEDPDDWDANRLHKVSDLSKRVLYICSGREAPNIGQLSNISIVGYQPSGNADSARKIKWGLEFSPYGLAANELERRVPHRAVVALGGAENKELANSILSALAAINFIGDIVYLGSPIGDVLPDETLISRHQNLRVLRNLPEIDSLIQSAGILIVSYGNLMFEALALCTPTCVLGIKPFQARYARVIEELGLAISVDVAMPDHARVSSALSRLQASKNFLVANCESAFKSNGFEALTALVLAELDKA